MSRKRSNRYTENRLAFEDIIGNPYAIPEPIEGHYIALHSRSSIKIIGTDLDTGHATGNPAKPSLTDFFCDVEKVITLGLTRYSKQTSDNLEKLQQLFENTYITEIEPMFTQKERTDIEQIMGRLLKERNISPVSMYFKTLRKKKNE